ncbi:MAG TPA: hypothetical protein VF229_03830 [Burkholderiaceae bacterium]
MAGLPSQPPDGHPFDALVAELCGCLGEETQALAAGDQVRLAAVVERKEALIGSLGSHLQSAARDSRRSPGSLAALRRARDLNRQNGALLAPRLTMNRARLQALTAAAQGGGVYAADGSSVGLRNTAGARPGTRA